MGAGDEGTKEFEPSQSKLNNLKRQGQVPKSPELSQLFSFIVAITFILSGSSFIWNRLQAMFTNLYGAVSLKTLDEIGPGFIIKNSFEVFLIIVLPMLFLVGASSAVGDILQTGLMFTPSQLSPKFDKLNPVNYFKQVFTMKKVVEILKQLIKVFVLSIVAYKMIQKHFLEILTLVTADSIAIVADVLKSVILDFTINSTIALLIIVLIDIGYERFNFLQQHKMTRKEMMDEFKQNEGDPHMKQKRRAMARQFSQGQQASLIPEADFITTNPSKIAVAVKYESGKMSAPKVLAKGSDSFAWRIVSIAKQHNIPVIENIPLARALFKLVKIGKEIPPELYRAVAEILLFAYQIKGKKKSNYYSNKTTSFSSGGS